MFRLRSIALVIVGCSVAAADGPGAKVGTLPGSLHLDPFYRKYADAGGIAIVASERVPDAAILVARDIVDHMTAHRPDLRAAMVGQRMRVVVMAQSESTTDLPEQRDWKKPKRDDPRLTTGEREHYDERIGRLTDREYWDGRARGMGGNPTSCAEENLLGYPGTRYHGENILVHEFAHGIMDVGIRRADPGLHREIRAAYRDAMARGLWKGHYAATTAAEYWAEGTQVWYWTNFPHRDGDRAVTTPDDLKAYDPKLYELLSRIYGDHHIPQDVHHAGATQAPRPRP